MIKAYLLADFGSTYTKLTAIDIEKAEIISTSRTITTVETDIMRGFNQAVDKLKLPKNVDFVKTLACSSAAGGLKMFAVGLAKNLTVEAAKRAALGAGARLIKVYSFELKDSDIKEIETGNADIILLCGGTDGGNYKNIIYNAHMLSKINLKVPVVIAGNKDASEEIKRIFDEKNIESVITENVMPEVNTLNSEPVREVIRELFMKHITEAHGMNHVRGLIDGILMPTPAAVIKAAKLISCGTDKENGLGDTMVLDIGGATTDVHTIGYGLPEDNEIRFEGMREPFEKRTVEGDLGMRYSAVSLYEAVGKNGIKKYLKENYDIKAECKRRAENIKMIPQNEYEETFEEAMAKACVHLSVKRHAGTLRKEFTGQRNIIYQKGKDLSEIHVVIGTGGVIINSLNPKEILKECEKDKADERKLKIEKADYYLDKEYILSAIGLLSMDMPEIALKTALKYIVKI